MNDSLKYKIRWGMKYFLKDNIVLPYRMHTHNKFIPMENSAKLTSDEIRCLKQFWGKDYNQGKKRCYEFYKGTCGVFDEKFIPNDYYFLVECIANKSWSSTFLQHKCCLKYFISEQYRPTTILQGINGYLLDNNDNYLTPNDAIELLCGYESFVYKPSLNTGGGDGVKKINLNETNKKNTQFWKELFSKKDFIIQEIIKQSDEMSSYNPDSVNTIRMLTLNLNNHQTLLSSFIRMGQKGSFTDNVSGNGCLVGINHEGILYPYGLTENYEKILQSPNGYKFERKKFIHYDAIKSTVLKLHTNFPSAALIAWDIALNEANAPIVIEINLGMGRVSTHQILNGPVFGERTLEVMDYIRANIKNYHIGI